MGVKPLNNKKKKKANYIFFPPPIFDGLAFIRFLLIIIWLASKIVFFYI